MQPLLKQILEAGSPPETKKQMAHRDLKFQNRVYPLLMEMQGVQNSIRFNLILSGPTRGPAPGPGLGEQIQSFPASKTLRS